MTPEIFRILNSIGWSIAERVSPIYARSLANRLTETGGRLSPKRTDSQVIGKQIEALMKSVLELHKRLNELPDGLALEINLAGQALDGIQVLRERKGIYESPDRKFVENATHALWALLPGIEAVLSRAEAEAGQTDAVGKAPRPRGAPKNAAAYEIAEVLARIFVLGTGRMPSIGRREDGRGVSGEYGRAVEGVFGELGLRVSDAYPPCKAALGGLSEEERQKLMLMRCPITRVYCELRMEKRRPVV